MPNPTIPDPKLTREEAEALLWYLTADEELVDAARAKLNTALSAPLVEQGGVEEAVEVLAKSLSQLYTTAGEEPDETWDEHTESTESLREEWRGDARSLLAAIQPFLAQQSSTTGNSRRGDLAQVFRELKKDDEAVAQIARAINCTTISDHPSHPRAHAAIDAIFAYFVATGNSLSGEPFLTGAEEEGHRIEITFTGDDGMPPMLRLLHPKEGCDPGEDDPATAPCWLADWLENADEPEGMVCGKVIAPVTYELDGDQPRFNIQPSFARQSSEEGDREPEFAVGVASDGQPSIYEVDTHLSGDGERLDLEQCIERIEAAIRGGGFVDAEETEQVARAVLPFLRDLATRLSEDCYSCGEPGSGTCPKSKRPCGHHCNCSWVHDLCHWCGKEFGEEPLPPHLSEGTGGGDAPWKNPEARWLVYEETGKHKSGRPSYRLHDASGLTRSAWAKEGRIFEVVPAARLSTEGGEEDR